MRGTPLLLAVALGALLAGCQSGNEASDISKEQSPSASKSDAPTTKVEGTKSNPAANYPKSAAGQGDALK